MPATLQIAHELALPLETAATQTYAFLGRKGSGKTYAASRLVELLLDAGVQVLVLDNVGNWGSGLRLSADGKGKGFDVPVLGGLRGDVPLEEGAGKLVADTLADTRRSAVLDMSQFSLASRRRFATAFGAAARGHCPLRVMEADGTETHCMWRSQHGGRCSFEVKCAGHPDRECSKHWGHEPPCDLGGEALPYYASDEESSV